MKALKMIAYVLVIVSRISFSKGFLLLTFIISIQFGAATKVFADSICNTTVGDSPYGVMVTPDSKRVYVANFGSSNVSVIDADPLSAGFQDVVDTINVGNNPVALAITSGGERAYVTNYGSNSVSVIDIDPLSGTYHDVIDTITVGNNPHGIAIVFDDTRVYVNNHLSDTISVIDTDPLSGTYHDVIDTLSIGTVASDILISPDGERAYVLNWDGGSGSTISVVDIDPLSGTYHDVIDTITAGTGVHDLTMSSDGKKTYVTNYGSNTVSVIDTDPLSGTYHDVIDTITVGTNPLGITVTPDDKRVYVANWDDNTVSVIDTDPLSGTYHDVIDTIIVGANPTSYGGDFISPDGNYAFILNYTDGTVLFIDTNSLSPTFNTSVCSAPVPNTGSSGGGSSSNIQATCKPSKTKINIGEEISFDIKVDTDEEEYTFKWTKVLEGDDENERHTFSQSGQFYPRALIKTLDGNSKILNCGTIIISEDNVEDAEEEAEEEAVEEKESLVCNKYISVVTPIKYGLNNDVENVKKIQSFLNKYENKNLDISGIYDISTENAVKDFQMKYLLEVLSPWGYELPTGIVYTTTAAKMNAIHCASYMKCPIFTKHTRLGDSNEDVPVIKSFLNLILDTKLDTNSSFYDQNTFNAVKDFQNIYKDFVLKPWGLSSGTGFWYKTSIRQSNKFMGCKIPQETLENGVFVD